VSLVLRERPWSSVAADMIDGFVAANDADDAEDLRDLLWGIIEDIDLTGQSDDSAATVVRLHPAA
jgi:hypothetical protein